MRTATSAERRGLVCENALEPHDGESTLALLMTQYGDVVRRTARRITCSDLAAQEITQDVFMRAWRHGGHDPERGSMEKWLRMMTQYASIDWVRREVAHRRRLERAGVATAEIPAVPLEEAAADSRRAAEVRAAVADLPTAERQAVSLAYFGGLSYREVAERLGLAEGTVKSQIRRALVRLGQLLA